ncbi:MAG TPA: hypothetical protein VMH87_15100 [Pseudomonadales bacterium]|nr:hypothetical protein [Pseudomonadales bacterium]
MPALPKKQRSPKRTKVEGLPEGFASYQPGFKRKLNVFPDKDAVLQILGHDDGKPPQEWRPEDRMIDTAGQAYRMSKEPGKKYYDLEPTGETWSYERLLGAAEADYRLMKKDPETMRHQLDGLPESERMAVLMKCIDELPVGPRWFMPAFFLFLFLFFVAVMFIAGKFFMWLQNHLQK